MNIKVGDKVLYKSLAATSIGTVQEILGDSYYIINGMVVYSFEILMMYLIILVLVICIKHLKRQEK